jgi:protein-L-isoaspartate(D-aspartate) O-methyltransferase
MQCFVNQSRRLLIVAAAMLFVPIVAPRAIAQSRNELERKRHQLVRDFIEKEGVSNPRVLEAMRTVPRHEFMPVAKRPQAYLDAAWSIGFKQTISPPFVVAYMTQALDPQPTDRVLEIGTGSGYQAAVLSGLVKEVFTIEIVEPLGKSAEKRLKRLGYTNVTVKVGDGYLGWPEHAPFDKIIVTCSPENIPKPLVQQLKEGGRMVIPLGERYHQEAFLVEKKKGQIVRKFLRPTLFVPMTGRSEKERAVKPDPLHPQINNGGFELREPDGSVAGWHYQRQLKLVSDRPTEGSLCARFENEEPGRYAQALQGMAIDGRHISELHFTFKFRSDRIVDGREEYNQAGLVAYFYDGNRRIMSETVAAHLTGSTDWQEVRKTIVVPPQAREVILRLGLNGATGRLFVDDVSLSAEKR